MIPRLLLIKPVLGQTVSYIGDRFADVQVVSAGSPTLELLILQFVLFLSFCLFLSFSFIRPKPSRLFLHPSLLPQHNSKRMCVVVPSGVLYPNKTTAPVPFPVPPPAETQALSWLSPLSPVQLKTAGTFGLFTSALFLLSFSLSVFFPLTNPVSSTCWKSLLQLFFLT